MAQFDTTYFSGMRRNFILRGRAIRKIRNFARKSTGRLKRLSRGQKTF